MITIDIIHTNSQLMPQVILIQKHLQNLLWQRKEQLQPLWVICCTQSSRWVPPLSSMESLSPTANIGPVHDVVHDVWVGVKDRVDKTNWALADSKTLLIDLVTTH
jgi:hypothetical protein